MASLPPISASAMTTLNAPAKAAVRALAKPASTDAMTMAVIRDDLDQLRVEVEELVSGLESDSPHVASTTGPGMKLVDVRAAIAVLGGGAVVSAASSASSFSSSSSASTSPMHTPDAYATSVHASRPAVPSDLKGTNHICPNCTSLYSKVEAIALRALVLVQAKTHVASTLRKAQHYSKIQERELRRVKKERDGAVANGYASLEMLREAWWEIAVLRANADAIVNKDKRERLKEDHKVWESVEMSANEGEHTPVQQQYRLHCNHDRDQEGDLHRGTEHVVSSLYSQSHSYPDPTGFNIENLLSLLHHLSAENKRLVNVEADCQALLEERQVLPCGEQRGGEDDENREGGGQYHGDAWTLDRLHELERRNAYLEHRLRLGEEERSRMGSTTNLYADSETRQENEASIRSPQVRVRGRGWNLNLSLRGQRKKEDVEEGF